MNFKATTLQNIAIVIGIASVIGIGVSILAYSISCNNCTIEISIFKWSEDSPEKICKTDHARCDLPKIDDLAVYRNFTDKGKEKVRFLEQLVENPAIQNALKHSNEKDAKMSEEIRVQIYIQREKEWINSQELTPLMTSIIYNKVSDILRDNLITPSHQFGDLRYGEHILTNVYGGNVAITVKSDNYDQSRDDWWQYMFHDRKGLPFARECEFDKSADMNSEDIVIKITDENDEFIGILNSATPCDVIVNKKSPID